MAEVKEKKQRKNKKATEENKMSFADLVKAAQTDIGYMEEAKKHLQANYLFQIQVYVKVKIKRMVQKDVDLDLPVVCDLVFTSEEEAESYVPMFLSQVSKDLFDGFPLVTAKKGQPNKLEVNTKLVKAVVKPLTLVQAFVDK